ncbi:MAG: rhodanese-like domain-containing protein, partial [bacterium]
QQPPQLQAQPQVPGGAENYNAMGDPAWATAWKHYDWDQALSLYNSKKALFCDARSKLEYDQGHIPGAIPLPLAEFDKYYALYEKQIKGAKRLVTYCHGAGCQLSNKVAQKLWQKNYRNVGSFFGGWPQWQEHNMPVQSGGAPQPQ